MSELNFKPYIYDGSPEFIQNGDLYQIVNKPGDSGRWNVGYSAREGDERTIMAQVRTRISSGHATVVLVWWKDVEGYERHSSVSIADVTGEQDEFQQFIQDVVAPPGVKGFRLDLRARTAVGFCEWRDVRVVERADPPDPTEPPAMITVSLNVGEVRWRVTASVDSITAARIPQ